MKKGKILTFITEKVEKTYLSNMNEDSYYDGHKFVEYGKNIPNVSLILPADNQDYSVNKEKLVINWGVKFEFRNSGVEGVEVSVLNMEADLVDANKQETPINFGEYKFEVIKEKNVESKDIQLFITSIEVDVEQKLVNVTVSI